MQKVGVALDLQTSSFGSAIQVLPSDNGWYFKLSFIAVVIVGIISFFFNFYSLLYSQITCIIYITLVGPNCFLLFYNLFVRKKPTYLVARQSTEQVTSQKPFQGQEKCSRFSSLCIWRRMYVASIVLRPGKKSNWNCILIMSTWE